MHKRIISDTGITLLGGGELPAGALERALARAPRLVAADAGGDHALARGLMPEAVIGDLDSLSAEGRAKLAERLWHVPAQDDTDFDKALDRIEAPFVLALGFTGGRLDHTLAALSALARRPHKRTLVWGGSDLVFLAPPELELALPPGTRLSLWPVAPVTVESSGLVWPTHGLTLTPNGLIGTSNAVAEKKVRLSPAAPTVLVMTPTETLEAVLEALLAAPSWSWNI